MSDRIKPSGIIFDIWALCTEMAILGIKGLRKLSAEEMPILLSGEQCESFEGNVLCSVADCARCL